MKWPFNGQKSPETSQTPPALDDRDFKIYELEMRIAGLEQAIIVLCQGIKFQLDRVDSNTIQLDKNMHNLAAMTLRPPKDLLGGGQEPN
jgi:hypothetical protein